MIANNQPINNPNNKNMPIKKQWQKPDFVILDSYDINAKNNNAVKEHTGHVSGSIFVSQNNNTAAAHKSTCIS